MEEYSEWTMLDLWLILLEGIGGLKTSSRNRNKGVKFFFLLTLNINITCLLGAHHK